MGNWGMKEYFYGLAQEFFRMQRWYISFKGIV